MVWQTEELELTSCPCIRMTGLIPPTTQVLDSMEEDRVATRIFGSGSFHMSEVLQAWKMRALLSAVR